MAARPCVVRRIAWTGAGAVAAVVAWLVGLVTFLAEVDGCTWWQRQAWLLFGAMMAAVLPAFEGTFKRNLRAPARGPHFAAPGQ
jgi:uncharacterized membrane protein